MTAFIAAAALAGIAHLLARATARAEASNRAQSWIDRNLGPRS